MREFSVKKISLKNGETIAYREAGFGRKILLLLHGNISSSVVWQSTMERLESEFRMIALDLRGFGDSTYYRSFDSLKELAEDLVHFVDALELEKFVVVGWSAGGNIGLELALLLPDRVEKVVLIAPVGLQGYPMFERNKDGKRQKDRPIFTKEQVAADPVQVIPVLRAIKEKDAIAIENNWIKAVYGKVRPPEEEIRAAVCANMKQRCLVDFDYALLHFNFTSEDSPWEKGSGGVERIKCPVVLIHGEEDRMVSFESSVKAKEFFGEKSTLISMVDVGHSPMTDEPEAFCELLRIHAK